MCDRAHAEPKRLTTEAQRAKIVEKRNKKAALPTSTDIDKAFPDKKQADIVKSLIGVINEQ